MPRRAPTAGLVQLEQVTYQVFIEIGMANLAGRRWYFLMAMRNKKGFDMS